MSSHQFMRLRRNKIQRSRKVHSASVQDVSSAELMQRAVRTAGGSALSPDGVRALGATHGNHYVQRLLEVEHSPTPTIQRLMSRAEWEESSRVKFGLHKFRRSDALQDIDAALGKYDQIRDSEDYTARQKALWAISKAIEDWKKTKDDPEETKRWPYIKSLQQEVNDELKDVEDRLKQKEVEAEAEKQEAAKKVMDEIVPPDLMSIVDPATRAKAIFANYMKYFRGKATYTTTTQKGVTIFESSGTVACATISQGLRDTFRYAGIESKVIQIPTQNFITKPLTGDFVDPASEGNVRSPGGSFGDVKRFFFSKHWIVEASGAKLYFDPTSGIEVKSDGSDIADPEFAEFKMVDNGKYQLANKYILNVLQNAAASGSGYELVKIEST